MAGSPRFEETGVASKIQRLRKLKKFIRRDRPQLDVNVGSSMPDTTGSIGSLINCRQS